MRYSPKICFFCSSCTLFLIHDGRVIYACKVESMYIFWTDIYELWNIFLDKFCFTIEFFTLKEGIEYTEWLRIGTDTCWPLPVPIIHSAIVVEKIACKKLLSPPPVNQTVFCDKRCYHHTQTIVHKIGFFELTDSRIDKGISCLGLFDLWLQICIILPINPSSLLQEFLMVCLGKIMSNMVPKFSPSKLLYELWILRIGECVEESWTHKTES